MEVLELTQNPTKLGKLAKSWAVYDWMSELQLNNNYSKEG